MNSNTSTNSIVRQLKIDLITDTPNRIIEWFNDLWNTLCIIETNVYHKDGGEFVYYVVNDLGKQWIFFQDDKNEQFWCNYNQYWLILETNFNLEFIDIQSITKLLVENALNNNVATTVFKIEFICKTVENALNNSVATPSTKKTSYAFSVENALNNTIINE